MDALDCPPAQEKGQGLALFLHRAHQRTTREGKHMAEGQCCLWPPPPHDADCRPDTPGRRTAFPGTPNTSQPGVVPRRRRVSGRHLHLCGRRVAWRAPPRWGAHTHTSVSATWPCQTFCGSNRAHSRGGWYHARGARLDPARRAPATRHRGPTGGSPLLLRRACACRPPGTWHYLDPPRPASHAPDSGSPVCHHRRGDPTGHPPAE